MTISLKHHADEAYPMPAANGNLSGHVEIDEKAANMEQTGASLDIVTKLATALRASEC
jgi:hypothetical protein